MPIFGGAYRPSGARFNTKADLIASIRTDPHEVWILGVEQDPGEPKIYRCFGTERLLPYGQDGQYTFYLDELPEGLLLILVGPHHRKDRRWHLKVQRTDQGIEIVDGGSSGTN